MAGTFRLAGTVAPSSGDSGGRAVSVVVTRGRTVVASAGVGSDGRFDLEVPSGPGLVVTVIGRDGRVLRRAIGAEGAPMVDLGKVKMEAAESTWHRRTGVGRSRRHSRHRRHRDAAGGANHHQVGASRRPEGEFAFELSARNPLTSGRYDVLLEVPGFRPAKRAVRVTDELTSYWPWSHRAQADADPVAPCGHRRRRWPRPQPNDFRLRSVPPVSLGKHCASRCPRMGGGSTWAATRPCGARSTRATWSHPEWPATGAGLDIGARSPAAGSHLRPADLARRRGRRPGRDRP